MISTWSGSQQRRLDCPAELLGRAAGLLRPAEQIGPCQIADEQRATGQHQRWDVGAGLAVVDQQTDVRRGMPGCGQHLDAHVPELDHLALLQRAVVVPQLGRRRAPRLRSGAGTQLGQAGQIIVVAVRVGGEGDPQAVLAGHPLVEPQEPR